MIPLVFAIIETLASIAPTIVGDNDTDARGDNTANRPPGRCDEDTVRTNVLRRCR
jgi:hypothetical protein